MIDAGWLAVKAAVGAAVSTIIVEFAPKDPLEVGAARVSVASFRAMSRIVPPFNAIGFAPTESTSPALLAAFAAAIVSTKNRVGVDIEMYTDKVEKVKHKYLSAEEQFLLQKSNHE